MAIPALIIAPSISFVRRKHDRSFLVQQQRQVHQQYFDLSGDCSPQLVITVAA